MGLRVTMQAVQIGKADEELTTWLWEWWNERVQPWHRDGVRHALTVLTGHEPPEPSLVAEAEATTILLS